MRIVIIMSVGSHQNAVFGLARQLRELGHQIVFGGTEYGIYGENLKLNATNQGYDYCILDPYSSTELDSNDILLEKNKKEFLIFSYNLLESKIFQNFISELEPDVVLLDIHLPIYAIAFYPCKIPVVFLSTELSTRWSKFLPPITSGLVPETSSSDEVALCWKTYLDSNKMTPALTWLLDELSQLNGFPMTELFTNRCIVLFGINYPEVVLWPLSFEFDAARNGFENTVYVGGWVDVNRRTREQRPPELSKDDLIVYCAIGTVLNDEILIEFVGRLIKAFKSIPNCKFLVAAGRLLESLEEKDLPTNVSVYKYLHQIEVLKVSALMITMAGANSIKECIELEVPMLCYPFHNDQFGNSARVQYHGIGLTGNICDSPDDIALNIRLLLENLPSFKKTLQAFRKKCSVATLSKENLEQLLLSFIDSYHKPT